MELELDRVDENLEAYHEFDEILLINKIKHQDEPNKKANGFIEICFKNTSDQMEPFAEQMTALEYFNENQKRVLSSISEMFFEEREDLEEAFGPFHEESFQGFPKISRPEDIWKYIDLSTMYLHTMSFEGCSIMSFFSNCPWDIEHALGIVLHKDKILKIGDWDTANYPNINETALEYTPVATTYSLNCSLLDRNPNAVLPNTSELNLTEYVSLFDWLNEQRAIRGYRQTKANISPKEKAEALLDLTHLVLDNRKLSNLPSNLKLLINLVHIDICGNHFNSFPTVFFKLYQLESMDLSFNSFEKIDPEIINLSNLNYVDLSNNGLRTIPSEFFSLPNLKHLILDGNGIGWLHKLKLKRLAKNGLKISLDDK